MPTIHILSVFIGLKALLKEIHLVKISCVMQVKKKRRFMKGHAEIDEHGTIRHYNKGMLIKIEYSNGTKRVWWDVIADLPEGSSRKALKEALESFQNS